jgi:peptidoglycan/xylan/chitin deacetylase (PgdA/CDA1 family)
LRLSTRRAGVALVYHAVDERYGDEAREVLPPRECSLFRRDLRYLRRHFDVVPAADLPLRVAARRRGQRLPVSVTFDDDLPEHVEHALPLLAEEGVKATFFLCGASLASPRSFWWERMQRALDAGATVTEIVALLPEQTKSRPHGQAVDVQRLVALIRALTPAERDALNEALSALAGPDPPTAGLRSGAVRELALAGHTIGFHTRRHDDLATLDDAALGQALRVGREDLERLAGQRIDLIAYPHGSADPRVAAAAQAAGFKLGFTVAQRAITPASDAHLLGRLGPSGPVASALRLSMLRLIVTAPR